MWTRSLWSQRSSSHLRQSHVIKQLHLTSRVALKPSKCKARHLRGPSPRTSMAIIFLHLRASMTSTPASTWRTSKYRSHARTSAVRRCHPTGQTCHASWLIHSEDAQLLLDHLTEPASLHHGVEIATAPDRLVGDHRTKSNESAPVRSDYGHLRRPCTCLSLAWSFHVSIFSPHACRGDACMCCVT